VRHFCRTSEIGCKARRGDSVGPADFSQIRRHCSRLEHLEINSNNGTDTHVIFPLHRQLAHQFFVYSYAVL
jgi:hypothetical protein